MRSFFEGLYLHHISPATLPIEVGVPVRGMLLIETASIEWQAWLYMDVFQEKRTGEKIFIADIIHIFRKRSKKGDIKFRPLPLLHEKPIEYPVGQYIMLLEQFGYLSKLKEGVFKVEREITLPFTSDQAQILEKISMISIN